MPVIDELVAGGAAGILDGIGKAAVGIRTAITGEAPIDPDKRAELQAKLMEIEQASVLAQLAVNKAEAESPSVFKGGWRPMVGWVCASAFAVQFVLGPIASYSATLYRGASVPLPVFDMSTLMPVLFGMLGLGAYRTVEKIRGVS